MSITMRGDDQFGAVLVLIIAVLALAPFDSTVVRPVITGLLALTIVFSLWTAGAPRTVVAPVAGLAGLCLVASAGGQLIGGRTPRLIYAAVGALLCAGAIVVVGFRLASHRLVTARTVSGALTVYLLLGLLFSFVFVLIGTARSAGFFAQRGPVDAVSYLYFSFLTLTTVGYGDLTAGNDLGRMLAVLEALLGQLYLVTVVAVLVANIGRERAAQRRGRRRNEADSE
jgi:ion channel